MTSDSKMIQNLVLLLKQTITAFLEDRGTETAAALTFTTLFAVVPAGTLLLTVVSLLPWLGISGQQAQDQIFHHWMPGVGDGIQPYIQGFLLHAARLTTLGLGMLFLTSVMMFISVERALNKIWRIHTTHKGRVAVLRYWMFFSLGPLLMGAALGLSSYLGTLKVVDAAQHMVHDVLPGLSLLSWILTALAFAFIYALVPHCRVPWSAAWTGALFASLLFEMAKLLFGWFVLHLTSYTLVYGAWASFPFFLIWVDLAWIILLLGAQLTKIWALRHRSQVHEPPVIVFLRLLQELHQQQIQGKAVSEMRLMQLMGIISREEWNSIMTVLFNQKWIVRTSEDDVVLNRDLQHMSVWSMLRALHWDGVDRQSLDAVDKPWARRLERFLKDADVLAQNMLPLTVAQLWDVADV